MKYATVCSGIEACSVAWEPLGWEPVFFSEIEAFPNKLLNHYYPDVPNLGDMKKINGNEYSNTIDVFCGGTPCQSFSLAGLRGGLADERGNLALTFCRLVDQIRPKWVIWENVPGVLSSNKGRDFGSIVGALAHIGYGIAWRVLDAQHFGVPQRRRRIFLVGHIGGNWATPAAVLFEPESVCGNIEKVRSKGEGIAGTTEEGIAIHCADVAPTLSKSFGKKHGSNQDIMSQEMGLYIMSTGQANAEIMQETAPTINCNHEQPIVCFNSRAGTTNRGLPSSETAYTLDTNAGHAIQQGYTVRRITPLEAERLQGFPDGYTKIPGAADTPRYEALGNSMAVPVMQWLGRRIEKVEKVLNL
jgi:DNA (cytosine-5)-methyltransferase 1